VEHFFPVEESKEYNFSTGQNMILMLQYF